jgi:flagellar basal-body rod protein FlgB
MFLDKVLFNKTKAPVLTAVLDVTQLRQRVTANNIANVSTKGYRKQSVRFKEYLDSFVRKPPVEGQTTDPRHITVPKPTENPTVFEVPTGPNDTGLNNIDIDIEMADLAENHLFFNVGARLLAGTFDGLKKSIAGRPHG